MKRLFLLTVFLAALAGCYAVYLSEGFEGTQFPPYDWTVVNANGNNSWESNDGHPHTGYNCACNYTFGTGGGNDWLISPLLCPSSANHTFSFYAASFIGSNSSKMNVKLSTATNSVADFTVTLASDIYPSTNYQLYSYDLSAYIGQNVYIAFQDTSTGGFLLFVDDVTGPDIYVPSLPPCPAINPNPANAAINLLPEMILNWGIRTGNAGGNPQGFRLFFGTDGGGLTPPTNICNNLDLGLVTTYNPNPDLAYSTTYYWQAVPYNVYGSASNCPIWSFTTVVPRPLPYLQNFNASIYLPTNWYGTGIIGTYPVNHGVGGTYCLTDYLYTGFRTSYAVSELIGPLSTASKLVFDYRLVDYNQYPQYGAHISLNDNIQVMVSTDDGNTFTEVYNINYYNHITSNAFRTLSINLSAYTGSCIMLKFVGHWGTGAYYTDFDNIRVMDINSVTSFPSQEAFDSDPWPYDGWSSYILSNVYNWTNPATSIHPDTTPYQGSRMMFYNSYNAPSGSSACLVSPPLWGSEQNYMYTLSFWFKRNFGYPYNADRVEVYTSPNPNLTNAALVGTAYRSTSFVPAVTTEGWYEYTFEIGNVNNAYRYVLLKAVSDYGNNITLDYVTLDRIAITAAPAPAVVITPLDGSNMVPVGTVLNWLSGGNHPTGYRLYFGTDGGGVTHPTNVCNNLDLGLCPYYIPAASLEPSTTYYWQVVPYNFLGSAANCPIWSFTTVYPGINITNGSVTMSPGQGYAFYDSGGPETNYADFENYTYTFYPPDGYRCKVEFISFNTEGGYDFLTIYNGINDLAPVLGSYTGQALIPPLTADCSPGALTFRFTSDYSASLTGWTALITLEQVVLTPPVITLTYTSSVVVLTLTPAPGAAWYGLYYSMDNQNYYYAGWLPGSFTEAVMTLTEPSMFFRITSGFGNPPGSRSLADRTDMKFLELR